MSSCKVEITSYKCDVCGKEEFSYRIPEAWYIEKLPTKWYQLPAFRDYCEECKPKECNE